MFYRSPDIEQAYPMQMPVIEASCSVTPTSPTNFDLACVETPSELEFGVEFEVTFPGLDAALLPAEVEMWLLSGHDLFGRPEDDPALMLVLRDAPDHILLAFSNFSLREPPPEAAGWLSPFDVTQTSNPDGCAIPQDPGLACEPSRSDDLIVSGMGEELMLVDGQSGSLDDVIIWASQARTWVQCGADGYYEDTHFGMAANAVLALE